MNRITILLLLGGLIAYVGARRRRRNDALAHTTGGRVGAGVEAAQATMGTMPPAPLAVGVGLSAVDPEPLTQFGEAVDPEAVAAAHDDPAEQRARLPGKHLR
ncbi:MAG: hypothetical protein M3680_27270 [Myxococcota bacterium]|nr:hypothetical protein [Myxococcota bacterium]